MKCPTEHGPQRSQKRLYYVKRGAGLQVPVPFIRFVGIAILLTRYHVSLTLQVCFTRRHKGCDVGSRRIRRHSSDVALEGPDPYSHTDQSRIHRQARVHASN